MRPTSIFLIALACFPSLGLSADASTAKKFELGACTTTWYPKDARCGVYEVWENRAAKSGRKIPLQVVVLPATGPKRLPDPLLYFAGGPGGPSIDEGVWFARETPELRKDRDVLLIDSRGTGQSAALDCPELRGDGGIQGFLDEFIPADKARACRDRLQKTADLTQYSTDYTVDDAEEVRKALGYGKVNIMGTSYGTRTVQVYLRRHPGSVRTAVMSGVVPLDESVPLFTARHSQRALEGLIAECAGDPACHKAFPRLREEVAAVLRRVEKEPVKLQVPSPETGQPIAFTMSKGGLGQVLRRMLYYNNWISLTPLYFHLAANGDWQPLAEFAQVISGGQGSVGGYFLSVTCSEDLAFTRKEEIPAAVAGTFLGDLRVRKQLEACEGWPAPKLGPEFRTPVTSDIPTLLLSGGADPVTPPSQGDRVARTLKRSRHVVVEDGGHGLGGMEGGECDERMITAFIAAGSAESLDTSCVARMRRPDFLLNIEPEVKLKPEELKRLAGTWVDKEGTRFKTEVVGGYLRAASPFGQVLMAATSPTRFRLRSGEPWLKLSFDLQDGRAVSMTAEEPGGTRTLTRETASQVEWKPCTVPWYPKDARCGVYEVWENRAAKAGRKIPLQVVVLPATGPERRSDPLVYFAGGPGGSAIGEGVGYARGMPELRKERDVLLIDARGTGESAALDCPELGGAGGLQGLLEDFMPAAKVRACGDRLQKSADLTQYSNDNVVDDTEEIRAALGYGKLNLMGTSYGARPVQVYLRRHPGSVRSAAMISPVPIDEIFPLVTARHSQRALDLLIAECEGDPACHKAFPKLRDEVAAVLRRVAKEPVKVQTVDAETGQPVELTLSKNGFGQVLRRMLYYNNWISLTPLYLHLAANGDWRPLAEMAPAAVGGQSSLGGHFLSITCSEDLPFVREGEIPAAVAGTFLGDLRVRKQLEVCQGWPAPKLGPELPTAVTSDVPALVLSGEVDPVTPPSSGNRVARGLKRGRHIVVPDAGHGLDGMEGFECLLRMVSSFVMAGSPESLDTSCVAGMRRPDFLLSLDPEVKLKPEELARVTGAWLGRDGLRIRTEAVNGYLRVVFPNGNVLLAATSRTSFRRRSGEPGFLITFDLQGGRAVGMTLREGDGTQTLKRETAAPASQVELKPCAGIPDLPPEARCGTYEVWENRTAKSGRKIPLRVLVLPAQGPGRQPDPFVFFNGGPGDSNVDAASWLAEEVKEILKRRDLLLVDFRGTGGSGGLFCPEMETSAGLQGYLDHFLPPDQVRVCAERLAKTADFSQYTNDTSVDDVDEVRAALGYEKVNLYGGSGGSRTVLVYLRRHPDKVRTAILSGLVPTDERGPFPMARHAQRALDGLLAECDRDEACRTAFPGFRDELAAVLQRAAKEPAVVALTDGETGKPVEVRLTRNALITTVRSMLYRPASAARLPYNVHQAALGNWQPMAEAAQAAGSGLSTFTRGYYLSLTCAEDLPFIREEEIPAVVQGSFLGDFRIRAQQAACAAWPVPPVGREFLEPVTSDVPALLISGERDPVTPPANGERAARTLKNSLHVVVPHAGHGYDGLEGIECLTHLMTRFVETGTVKGLDGSCLARVKRPAFALEAQP